MQFDRDTGVDTGRDDNSDCQCLPSRSDTKPIIAKFVRIEVKSAIKRGKVVLIEKKMMTLLPCASTYRRSFETGGTSSMQSF